MARNFMYEIPIGGIPPTRRRNYEVNDSNYISDYNARIIQEAANANQQRLQQNRQERNIIKYNLERENALRSGIPNSMYPTTREEMDILNQSIIDRNINNPANLSIRYSFKHGGRIKARYGLPTDPPTRNSIPTVYDPETGQMVGAIPEVEVGTRRPSKFKRWWNRNTRSERGYYDWLGRWNDKHNNVEPNPQTVYANQLYYNQYMDQNDVLGNNSRLPGIIDAALANKEYVNKDGTLNQKGNAYILQQKYFGPGSHYYNEMDKSAIQTANMLFGVASAPYLAASFANAPLQTAGTIGGSIAGNITGRNLGKIVNKDFGLNLDPRTVQTIDNLGGLAGGLIGGGLGYDWGRRIVQY